MVRRGDRAAAFRPGFSTGVAGLCDVRAGGCDAGESMAVASLGRRPFGHARVQSGGGQRGRDSGRGDDRRKRRGIAGGLGAAGGSVAAEGPDP